jgi:hypothetical protein
MISTILRGVYRGAICEGMFARSRARGASRPQTETLHKIHCLQFRASVHFQSVPVVSPVGCVIAAVLPRWREARSLRRILSRVASRFGPNLFRRFTAAGTCFSFLRSLLKFFQEPRSGVTYALNLAPAFLSVPAVHVTNMAQERSENAEIKAGNIRNVVR